MGWSRIQMLNLTSPYSLQVSKGPSGHPLFSIVSTGRSEEGSGGRDRSTESLAAMARKRDSFVSRV